MLSTSRFERETHGVTATLVPESYYLDSREFLIDLAIMEGAGVFMKVEEEVITLPFRTSLVGMYVMSGRYTSLSSKPNLDQSS